METGEGAGGSFQVFPHIVLIRRTRTLVSTLEIAVFNNKVFTRVKPGGFWSCRYSTSEKFLRADRRLPGRMVEDQKLPFFIICELDPKSCEVLLYSLALYR